MKAPKMRSSIVVLPVWFLRLTSCATRKEPVLGYVDAYPSGTGNVVVKGHMAMKFMGAPITIRVFVASVAFELLFGLSAVLQFWNQHLWLGC